MEFGMFHQFPALPGRPQKDAFEEAFAQIEAAERWGLDVMWLAELHFDPQRSLLSAPLSIASAVAARTSRIKIGIAQFLGGDDFAGRSADSNPARMADCSPERRAGGQSRLWWQLRRPRHQGGR